MTMIEVLLPQNGIVRVGVAVFVFRDDRFLMVQRTGSHGAGSWSLPGGWMDFGETPEATAVREVKEEVGLSIIHPWVFHWTNDIFPADGKHCLTLWVRSIWDGGEPSILEPNKATALEWVHFDGGFPKPLFHPFANFATSGFGIPLAQMKRFARRNYPEKSIGSA